MINVHRLSFVINELCRFLGIRCIKLIFLLAVVRRDGTMSFSCLLFNGDHVPWRVINVLID